MLIPSTDIGFFVGLPESYCIRFNRECEKRMCTQYDFVKALIVEFLEGRLIEVDSQESLDVCVTSADGARPQK